MRRVCAALDEQCRAANMRAQFKDDIIKEMRRQLKQAKAKVTFVRRVQELDKYDLPIGDLLPHSPARSRSLHNVVPVVCV